MADTASSQPAPRAETRSHVTVRRVIGACYVLAGVLLLLVQLDVVNLSWSVVVPGALVVLGATLLVSGLVDAHTQSHG